MKTSIAISLVVVGFLSNAIAIRAATATPAPPVTSIIPAPMKAEARDGQFKLTEASRIITDETFKEVAKLLAERLRPAPSFPLSIKSANTAASAGDIVLTTNRADTSLGPEGYQLSVRPTRVTIRASTAAGILYGEQSLLQLLPADIFSPKPVYDVVWNAPCVEISDAPRFPWRGMLLDVARHFFTKPEVEQVLDLMALYKLNTFQWHLTDDQGWRLEIKKYPDLTKVGAWRDGVEFGLDPKSSTAYDKNGRYGGFYTQHDIREMIAYAAARHMTIVPEIEMPGHAGAALRAYPQFGCPGVKAPGVYCVGNEATFTFLSNILAEVATLFPGKYIHIGGDEVDKANWKACPLCQARIKNEGLKNEHELQSYFIRRIEKIVNAQGKTLIGWSEIREGGLAPNAVLMDWIGGGAESASSGHDVVMSPTKYCYIDYYQSTNQAAEPKAIGGYLPLKQVYQFEPVPESLAPEFRSHVLGAQANLWTEYVANLRHAEYMMFPRLEALAELAWSPKDSRDWDNFKSRLAINEKRLTLMGVNFRPLSKPD